MKNNKYFFVSLFILAFVLISISNVTLSQSSSPNNNLKEFDGVKIYKPESGFLKFNTNWIVKKNGDQEEKVFLPYKIYDSNGGLYLEVEQTNYKPSTITLPAGTYYIKAADITGASIKFGVEIQAGKTTLVK